MEEKLIRYFALEIIQFYNISIFELFRKTRKRQIVEPRQILHSITKMILKNKITFETIGKHTGGFDHATVLYSVNVISDLINTNREFRQRYELIFFRCEKIYSILTAKISEIKNNIEHKNSLVNARKCYIRNGYVNRNNIKNNYHENRKISKFK